MRGRIAILAIMEGRRATTVKEVRRYFQTKPLTIEELDEYYAPTLQARTVDPVTTRLEADVRDFLEQGMRFQILFAGYRGCGKSTELKMLEKKIQDDYQVFNFSVQEKLDPMSMHYIELFIAIMDVLFEWIEENDIGKYINREFIDLIRNWSASSEVKTLRETHTSLEAEAGAGTDIKWFVSLFAKLRMAAKSSRSMKETITQNIEPKLSELLFLCDALVREVENYLREHTNKDGIVIIVEDLDKVLLERATDLFYNHVEQLVELNANIIYTFPLPLVYNIYYTRIKNAFTDCIVLPMIKVTNKDGSPNPQGRAAMKDIVRRRMDLALFEEETLLDQMIFYSGGCIRDLFLMIQEAAMSARLNDAESIGPKEYRRAYQVLKTDYDRTIADKVDPQSGNVLIRAKEYYDALVKLAESPDKQVAPSSELMDLRQNLTVVGYNGEEWCDVHPIMKDILHDRGLLPSAKSADDSADG